MSGTKTKFYLGGRYANRENLGKIADYLETRGFQCTHRWMEFEGHTPGEMAVNDIHGVMEADVVIVIFDSDTYAYRGTFTEIGAAIALNKPIYAMNYHADDSSYAATNCFYHHPNIFHYNVLYGEGSLIDDLLNYAAADNLHQRPRHA